jgi:hypothetical protein
MLVLQTLQSMAPEIAGQVGAVTMGSATSQDVPGWLVLCPKLLSPRRYLIATDRDRAGDAAARVWPQETRRARHWPPPDPCKVLPSYGRRTGIAR